MRTCKRGDDKGTRGSAVLEAAFSLPVLLLATFGVVEFGQAFWIRQNVVSAAAEAARVGSQASCPKATEAEIMEATWTTLEGMGLSPSMATIELANVGGTPGTDLIVDLTYEAEFPVLSKLMGLYSGDDGDMDVTVRVVAENE